MSAGLGFAAPRVVPNTAHAFGGIWRLAARRFFRVTHWLVLIGMLALLVLFSIAAASNRADAVKELLPWMARFYLGFLVPVLAFISAAGQMRDDLRSDAVDYLLTRPVRRPVFLLFRWISHMLCDQIDFLFGLGVVVGIGLYWDLPDFGAVVPRLLLAQVLAVLAASAIGYLCGLVTSRYVIVGLVYFAVIEVGIGNVPTQLNHLAMSRHLLAGILRPLLAAGDALVAQPPISLAVSVASLLGFTAVMLAAAATLFSFKELAGATGREA